MSINPDSVLHSIQVVNEKIDSCQGTLNEEMLGLVKETLDSLYSKECMTPVEKVALSALVSRISGSLEAAPLHEKVVGVVNRFFGNSLILEESSGSLPKHFLDQLKDFERILAGHSKDRERILLAAGPLIKEGMSRPVIANILTAIAKIPDSERESFCKAAAPLIKEGMTGAHIARIVMFMAGISNSERESVRSAAAIFIKEWMKGDVVLSILRTIDKISGSERESVCRVAEPFIKEGMEIESLTSILTCIENIPGSERGSVRSAAALFIKEWMRGYGVANILDTIAKIPDSKRDGVFRAAESFIEEGMAGYDVAKILDAIAQIPESEREGVFSAAKSLINPGMHGQGVGAVLAAIAQIPESEREGIFRAAMPLIKEGMTGEHVSRILIFIAGISDSERESFCKAAAPFLTERVHEYYVNAVLEQIARVPIQDRDLFRSCAEKTVTYRNEFIAEFLRNVVLNHGNWKGYMASIRHLTSSRKGSENTLVVHKILPSIILAKWIAEGTRRAQTKEQENSISGLISFLDKSKEGFRNNLSPLMQTFLETALSLDGVSDISSSRKLQLLSSVSNSSEHLKGFRLISSLLRRSRIEELNNLPLERPIEELTKAFEKSLVEDRFINLSGIENLVDKYIGFFGSTREPFALEVYMARLPYLRDESVRITLERFVRSVLEGTFENERYDTTYNPHLQRIQEYDKQNGITILDDWKNLVFTAPVNPILEATEEKAFSFEAFFKEKLRDGHGSKNGIQQLPELLNFLSASEEEKKILFLATTKKIEDISAEIKISSTPEKKKLAPMLKMFQAEKLCMELILKPGLSKEEQNEKIARVSSALSTLELGHDLKGLAKALNASQISISEGEEKVALCKDWEDLFLSGTEVAGSCQRIDGDFNKKKCLLAYCLDGKNAMVAVKDPEGKIVARSMLRLLWNKTDSKPVLFLDRLYPYLCPKEREQAISLAAKESAKQMGLELFTAGMGASPSEKIIESLGSSCPFEYADASDGVMPNGIFTIRNGQKVDLD